MPKPPVIFRTAEQFRAADASPAEVVREAESVSARIDYLNRSANGGALDDDAAAEVRGLTKTYEGLADLVNVMTAIDRRGVVAAPAFGSADRFEVGAPLGERRMVDYVRARGLVREDEEDLSFGRYVRGMVTGDWSGADAERRALVEGTATAGGHLVPTPLSAQIIDRARNATRVMQAGAQVVPMEAQVLKVARIVGDPTAAFHSELATIAASDMTFDAVTLTARSLASRVLISRELMEDADNVDDEVTKAFAAQFALTVDLAALYGSGTAPEPRGVRNTAGVTKTALDANGAVPTYDALIDSAYRVRGANHEPNAMIYAPRTGRTFAKAKDTTGQYLTPPAALEGVQRLETVQVPTNLTVGTSTDTSDVFTAAWSELLIGVRTRLEITVLRERSADVGAYELLAWWRGDVAVARPAAFDVVTGVRA
ncbi:MAG: phage major capsid protein [Actinomycetota bacterium]|nr:phage major capsid protein [Actinomycetota bacterium]